MKLLTPIDLSKLSKDELYNYIDKLHRTLSDYQIAIDQAVQKNKDVHY